MSTYRQLLAAQQRYQAQRENEAREAHSLHTLATTGVGSTIEPEPLMFPNPFVFKPALSYGAEVVRLPDQDLWGLPRLSGAVMRWEVNDRGFFLGAFVYVTVDLDPLEGVTPEVQPSVRAEHHFRFSSLAYKDLGQKILDQVQESSIEPKAVRL